MNSPRWISAKRAPKTWIFLAADRLPADRTRHVAKLGAAAAMVVGVGAGSALFVNYLADRALARGTEQVAVKPVVNTASATVEASAAAGAVTSSAKAAAPVDPQPVQPEPVPIEAAVPDPEVLAKVAVGGPDAGPLLQFAGETDDDGISPEQGPFATLTNAIPAKKPPLAEIAKSESSASESGDTELAALPGVGDPSGTVNAKARDLGGSPAAAARVKSAVNMRAAPKKGSGVLAVVPAGAQVEVFSCNGWCQISHEGRTGWVYKNFLAEAPQPRQEVADDTPPPTRGMKSPRL